MSAVLLYGKAAAYCKFRTLNPCLHTGRHSPTRLSQGSQSQPSTGRRAWEQLRPGLVWAGTAPKTQTPPGQAQLLQPLSRTLSHGLLHLLELGARKDLAQKDPCGFSKGEKSGRGFSCLQGCPPTPQLTVLSSHTPKLLHFPSQNRPWETEDISPHLVFQLSLSQSAEGELGSFPAAPTASAAFPQAQNLPRGSHPNS